MKPLLMALLVFAVCEGPAIRWRFNAPRPPWTNYEQEMTRHPSPQWGYAGKFTYDPYAERWHDGVYRK
jgi:hypothetical protein